MKEISELVANLLPFNNKKKKYLWKRINIPNFLRLEWMYAKFKKKVLKIQD